jgi:hypothetical protein
MQMGDRGRYVEFSIKRAIKKEMREEWREMLNVAK